MSKRAWTPMRFSECTLRVPGFALRRGKERFRRFRFAVRVSRLRLEDLKISALVRRAPFQGFPAGAGFQTLLGKSTANYLYLRDGAALQTSKSRVGGGII